MTRYAIRIADLTHEYVTVRALDRLTLEIPAGSIFGFLGSNGAGKTTTIHLLLGLLRPTAGRAEVLGCDVATGIDEIRRRTGALLDQAGLYERLSVRDNLEFYGRIWRMSRRERRARSEELLRQFGLWDRRKEPAGRLSFGMKRKLAVARALFHRPELVFLDEPTAGLDPMSAESLRRSLSDLVVEEGVTVFLTTHNVPEAGKLCDRVGVIRSGKLLACGSPDELRASTASNQLTIRGSRFTEDAFTLLALRPEVEGAEVRRGELVVKLAPGVRAAPIVSLLVGCGVQVEEVVRDPTFEDAFLSVLGGASRSEEPSRIAVGTFGQSAAA
ncbi:MAG: ABC transporter ATP-binding protein [Gemmatimonadetes bacterium]|nr:ABC transporter ATP-binding protein [Gemmatimonadota bacterium]